MKKTILVIGAEYQDAYDTAKWFAETGNKVYACLTGSEQERKEEQDYHGSNITIFSIDLNRKETVTTVVEKIEEEAKGLDILILRAGRRAEKDGTIRSGHNYHEILQIMDYDVNGIRLVIETALPLLRKSSIKRIALLTTKAASLNLSKQTTDFGYYMSRAALHMMEKLYFNQLRPEGFTFRCFSTDESGAGISAGEYIANGLCYDEKEPYIHSDENRLVMRDCHYREIPW